MPPPRLIAEPDAATAIRHDFERLRRELGLPDAFPDEVEAAARAAAEAGPRPAERADLRAQPFFTVDPPGSMDLDQAMQLERRPDGFLVRYAIADVAAFVARGGAVEAEAWRRGVTVYSPDTRVPLYPPALGEGAASLLPGEERPAVCFTIELGEDGGRRSARVERALVCSRERLDYAHLEGHAELLQAIGVARERRERARGAVRLDSPGQVVVAEGPPGCGYRLELERRLPAEDWNAQISLFAGMAAADIMLRAGVGLLRTMHGVDPSRIGVLRRTAAALGIDWPAGEPLAQLAERLHEDDPRQAALIRQLREAMGGAGYLALDGPTSEPPRHAALAAVYAHTTAPLRRLADRYVLDTLVELCAGRRPGADGRRTLAALPAVMEKSERRADALERACVDQVETRLLERRTGERFAAVVVDVDRRGAAIQIAEPPLRAHLAGASPPPLGATIEVVLARADPVSRSLEFRPAAA